MTTKPLLTPLHFAYAAVVMACLTPLVLAAMVCGAAAARKDER